MSQEPVNKLRSRSITRAASRDFALDLCPGLETPRRRKATTPWPPRPRSAGGEPREQSASPADSLEWDTLEDNVRLVPNPVVFGVTVNTVGDLRSLTRVITPEPDSDSDNDVFATPLGSKERLLIERQPLAHTSKSVLNKRMKKSELDKQLLDPSPATKLRRVSASESPLSPGSSTLIQEDNPGGESMNIEDTELEQDLVSGQIYTPGKGHSTPLKRAVIKRNLTTAYTSDAEAGPSSNPRETNPQGTNPRETNPRETKPRETNPQGTNPQGTKPPETKAVERRNLSSAVEKAAGVEAGSVQTGASAASTGGTRPGKATADTAAGSAQAGGSAGSTGGTRPGQATAEQQATATSTGEPRPSGTVQPQPAASGQLGQQIRSNTVEGEAAPVQPGSTAGDSCGRSQTAASSQLGTSKRRNPVEGEAASVQPGLTAGDSSGQKVNKAGPAPSIHRNMAERTLNYRVTVAEAIQFSLEEREEDEMLSWPDDYLREQVTAMNQTKTQLNAAMAALSVLDGENYRQRQEKDACQAKQVITKLVKEGLKIIKTRQDVLADYNRERTEVAAATSRIKKNRVDNQWPSELYGEQSHRPRAG